MNSNPTADQPPRPNPPASASRQVEWQVLEAGAARIALASMPPESPVLLIKLDELGVAGPMTEVGWEAMVAKSLLSQLGPQTPEVLTGPGGLELHPAARLAFCEGIELSLTSTEFSLLQDLLSRDGTVASVDDLSRAIWGHDTLGAPNYVEAHISRLRRKLRDAGAARVVETVRGSGYRVRQARPELTSMSGVHRERTGMLSPPRSEYERRDAA